MEGSREQLLEAATTAFRERDALGRILPAPSWADLDPEERAVLFRRQVESRELERLCDPQGLSTTARAVLERIRRVEQMRFRS